jgi:hypothetical protein
LSRFIFPVVLALAVVAASCTAARHVDDATIDLAKRVAVEKLSAQGTADSLLTAALVSHQRSILGKVRPSFTAPDDNERVTLAERAFAAAPNDPAIAWVRLVMCESAPGCDVREAGAAFRQLDPGNAAGWMADLRDAKQEGHDDGIDDILTRMASDSRFYVYYNNLFVRVTETLIAAQLSTWFSSRTSDPSRALIDAEGLVTGLPIFDPLGKAICADPVRRGVRLPNCLAITAVMRRGDALVVQSVGNGIRRRLAKPGTAECTEVFEWWRAWEWRMQQGLDVDRRSGFSGQWAAEQLSMMRALAREEDVLLETLRRAKVSTEPPAGWRPDRPPLECTGA